LKVLILGGNGFIGSYLTKLLSSSHEVVVFSRSVNWEGIKINNVKYIYGDFSNLSLVKKSLIGIDIVYHLISSSNPSSANENPIRDIEENLICSIRFLELLRDVSIKKLVYVSSGGTVYGEATSQPIKESAALKPKGAYAITKVAIEQSIQRYSRELGFEYCIIRPSNPYGPGQRYDKNQGVISSFLYRAVTNSQIEIWGDGNEIRDYIYVEDLTIVLSRVIGIDGSTILNVGSGLGVSTLEILSIVREVTGLKVSFKHVPKLGHNIEKVTLDNTLAKSMLNWEPSKGLMDGIYNQYIWIKNKLT